MMGCMSAGKKLSRVRLIDVAVHAGVSMKTVSNVVHDYPHVSDEVRTKVQRAIEELGYRPNVTARRLATGRTGMIALAIPEIDQPYFAELARNISAEASNRGYRVLVEQTLNSVEAERAVIKDRESGLVDGVIFHPVRIDTIEIARLRPGTPLVLLGEAARPLTVDHVMIDNVEAARRGVELLLSHGRRQILFLATVEAELTESTQLRLQGYQEALISAGVPHSPDLVLTSPGFEVEQVESTLASAMSSGLGFDAILCRDDLFAAAAIRALSRERRSVPEEVEVLGWDNTQIARFATPPISSIAPDKQAIARTALDLLSDRIEGHAGVGRHHLAPYQILERGTTVSPIYSAV